MDVAGIEACLSSCPQGIDFRSVVRNKLIPLLEESRAGIRDVGDAQRVCRGLEMLCLFMRSVRYKQLGMVSFVEALGVENDGGTAHALSHRAGMPGAGARKQQQLLPQYRL